MTDLHIDVFCNGCGNWESAYPEKSAQKARKFVKLKGWSVRRDVRGGLTDLCPLCTKTQEKLA